MKTYMMLLSLMMLTQAGMADRVQVVPRHEGGGRSGGSASVGSAPSSGSSGPVRVVPRFSIDHSRAIQRDFRRQDRVRVVPGRTYWRGERGNRYAHRYWNGAHWYGYYDGPRFYWTRYYHNRWWWYDPFFSRWTFWWNGFWWWNSPSGVYVVVNNTYEPYPVSGVDVPAPETDGPPPSGTPPSEEAVQNSGPELGSEESSPAPVYSPNRQRMVEIAGQDHQAFLYDTSGRQPVFLKALGGSATKARFSGGTKKEPLQILVEFQDGSFRLFNEAGEPVKP